MLILVEDVNDNVPVFEPHTPSILVREHSSTPLQLISLVAHDKDSGIYGQVIYSLESDQLEDLDLFSVSTMNNRAELKLVGEYFHEKKKDFLSGQLSFDEILIFVGDLDYERQSLHQLRIVAKDRANFGRINSATTGILIKVQDIEDKAPAFISVPSISRISEDVPTFSEVRLLLTHFFSSQFD